MYPFLLILIRYVYLKSWSMSVQKYLLTWLLDGNFKPRLEWTTIIERTKNMLPWIPDGNMTPWSERTTALERSAGSTEESNRFLLALPFTIDASCSSFRSKENWTTHLDKPGAYITHRYRKKLWDGQRLRMHIPGLRRVLFLYFSF